MVVGKSENQTSAVGRMLAQLMPQGRIVSDRSIVDAGFSGMDNRRRKGKDPIFDDSRFHSPNNRPLQNPDAFSPTFKRLLTEPGLLSGRKRVK